MASSLGLQGRVLVECAPSVCPGGRRRLTGTPAARRFPVAVPAVPSFRIFHVTKPMRHHGARAGYNRLIQHVPSTSVAWAGRTLLGRTVNGVTRRVLSPLIGSRWYGLAGTWAETRTALRARGGPRSLVHTLYGEDVLGVGRRLLGSDHVLVATFHQPPDRSERLIRSRVFRQLDAVIVLDAASAEWWRSRQKRPVYALSLGLDTDWWSPGSTPRHRRVLFVGQHLRDFGVLRAAVDALGAKFDFDVVVTEARARELAPLPGVTTHVGISDEKLRLLYREAAVMFLPLRAASASNSLLQALACGCPVVATDLPSIRDCVRDAGVLVPSADGDGHVRALRSVLESAQLCEMSEASRVRGLSFSWPAVGARHLEVYAEVMAAKR